MRAAKGKTLTDFNSLGLAKSLLEALAQQNISEPTPIQAQAIPHAMAGRDVMGLAQTGTGKTAAFGLPLVHKLIKTGERPAPRGVRALILAPTRELARQISDALGAFTRRSPLKVGIVVGGASINAQVKRMERGIDILVATPGRLIDLIERRAVNLGDTRFLVLDEADQMLDMGFIHALRRIAPLLPKDRQTMLFSATMPAQMAELAAAYLNDPVRVQVSPPGKAADKIDQSVHFVDQGAKGALLRDQLAAHPRDRALVFCRTKHGAERLMKGLVADGFAAASIHGNKSQGQRDRALDAFRDGKVLVLVATDVAARGIDVPGVRHVYNYEMPNVAENYVHRIGRTARAGADGRAVAFCAPAEIGELRAIEKLMKIEIAVAGGTPPARGQRGQPRPEGQGKPGSKPGKPANRGRRPRRRGGERMAA
ncbi:DEAD/DEAH box helicase [Halovulum dunhuangense]|nr:DEAD/DEAH box helicase [Halovulum dunhuangense]